MTKLGLLLCASAATVVLATAPAALAASRSHHRQDVTPFVAPVVEAASATPQLADGFVSLGIGQQMLSDDENSSDSARGLSIEGAASGEYNVTSTLGFQGDIVLQQNDATISGEDFGLRTRSFDGALHGFYRNDNYLIGAFAQYGTTEIGETDGSAFAGEAGFDRYYGGAEGQVFLGDFTLYGQAGVEKDTIFTESLNGEFANLEARYFLTPNFKIEGRVGIERLNAPDGSSENLTTTHAGVGAEYRFDDHPFSLFAKYDFAQTTVSNSGSSALNDNRFLVGVKFNLGTDTLEQRDRSGASLKPVESNGAFGGLGIGGPIIPPPPL